MTLDLSPARWIWLPVARTLPNTFALFRRELRLETLPVRATGWILADSRYRFTVNGERVQWGPAPADPRFPEADPLDISALLREGDNVLGVEVLYYGSGDGTWALGAPGLILRLDLEWENGEVRQIVSEAGWKCFLDRAHRPGQHKRWFLRALQEEFDARLHPFGWDTAGFAPDSRWMSAALLPGAADSPAIFAGGPEQFLPSDRAPNHPKGNLVGETNPDADDVGIRARSIPLMREKIVAAKGLAAQGRVVWHRDPRDWFESRVPDSFSIEREEIAHNGDGWTVPVLPDGNGAFLTFEFAEGMVGWPRFSIEAPAGTVIELMVQEGHDAQDGPLWLDSHIWSWSRFICREGANDFECFDFEALRWLQLHVHGHEREVKVSQVGMRRRVYPWPNPARVRCSEPEMQRLFDAALNTLDNSCQETCVDGMARERQQYSGDVGHQLRAVRGAFGETRQAARFLKTWSDGQTIDGFFLDCWPGFDRLARLMQRQVGATQWGPLLDHGVGFGFDCWQHFLETGLLEDVRVPFPRLLRFAAYLESLRGPDGLVPVEHIGVPAVWIDHDAYKQQRHKACAWNLYIAGGLAHALAPLCEAMGETEQATLFRARAEEIGAAARREFWCSKRRVWINNLPWEKEENEARMCDRSLAQGLLFDFCPDDDTANSLEALVGCPPEMGLSYPANASWRLQALAKGGRGDVVVADFRARWATMRSVRENNTLAEMWHPEPDCFDEWSHCPLAPLWVTFADVAGISALSPAFERVQIRPQLGDLADLDVVVHTPRGPISFVAVREGNGHTVNLDLPSSCAGVLVLPGGESRALDGGAHRFRVEAV